MKSLPGRIQAALRRRLPSREGMASNRWLAPIAHRFLSPELWRFTRRSVPRGVALGLFSGFIVPIGQIFLAAFLALPARANVPVAALVTFVTNPFTLPFWVVVANRVGRFTLRVDPTGMAGEIHARASQTRWDGLVWFAQSAGVTAVGFVVLAVVLSALGYLLSSLFWRFWIGRKLRERRCRRALRHAASRQTAHDEEPLG